VITSEISFQNAEVSRCQETTNITTGSDYVKQISRDIPDFAPGSSRSGIQPFLADLAKSGSGNYFVSAMQGKQGCPESSLFTGLSGFKAPSPADNFSHNGHSLQQISSLVG